MKCTSCQAKNPDAMKFCGHCGAPLRRAPEQQAELRQLTVLFCDLVGSTALSEQLEPEDLREVMASYHEACAAAIERHEGHVAQYLGDGLLVYFGYPVAQEDAAHRAVRAGLAIQEQIAGLNTELSSTRGISVAVRVGIHTGPTVVGEIGGGDQQRERLALGKTPNLAARIQNLAEPGAVLISDQTFRIVRGYFDVTSLGTREAKGLSESVMVHRVDRETEAQSRLDVARRAGLTPLIGREREMAVLDERWASVKSGGGSAVFVRGEAGIGKSRIVDTLRGQVLREDRTVLESYCSPYARQTTLFPIAGLLERTLGFHREMSDAEKRAALEARLGYRGILTDESLSLMSQLLSIPLAGDDPLAGYSAQKRRERTLETLVDWLTAIGASGPFLWVVEDLHWADPTTLELIAQILRGMTKIQALVVLTFRPDFDASALPATHVTTLAMARLAEGDTGAMASRVAGGKRLPSEVVAQLFSRTEGVPLFIEEVTKAVLELDVLVEHEDRYDLAGQLPADLIPSTIQDSLRARLDRLGSAKGTAQVAATIGREFRFDLLSAVAGTEAVNLRQDIGRLLQAELVYVHEDALEETYLFKHALIQDAAYQSMLKKSRRDLHLRIAEVLAGQFPGVAKTRPELLAEHYTGAGQVETAVGAWGLAAQMALGRAAYHEAISHLRRGLELIPDLAADSRDARELELQLGLIPALISTQGWASQELNVVYSRAIEIIDRQPSSPYRFLVLSGTLGYNLVGGRITRTLELCEEVLELAKAQGDPISLAMAHQNYSSTALYASLPHKVIEHAEAGMKFYDPQIEAVITQMIGLSSFVALPCYVTGAEWMMGRFDRVLAATDQAVAMARRHGHPHSISCALGFRCFAQMLLGDAEGTLATAEENIRFSGDQRLGFWVAPARIYRGWALTSLGRASEALPEIREALAFYYATGSNVCGVLFRAILAEAQWAVGDRAAAFTTLNEALAHARDDGEHLYEPEVLRLGGEWLMIEAGTDRATARPHDAEGRLAAAEDRVREALRLAREQQSLPLELRALITMCRIREAQGHDSSAEREELNACYSRFATDYITPELRTARSLLNPSAA